MFQIIIQILHGGAVRVRNSGILMALLGFIFVAAIALPGQSEVLGTIPSYDDGYDDDDDDDDDDDSDDGNDDDDDDDSDDGNDDDNDDDGDDGNDDYDDDDDSDDGNDGDDGNGSDPSGGQTGSRGFVRVNAGSGSSDDTVYDCCDFIEYPRCRLINLASNLNPVERKCLR